MPSYKIITEVDITRSNPDRDNTDTILKAQQSNFNSLVQGLELRANIMWDTDPEQILDNDGNSTWHWTFQVEQVGVYENQYSPVGLLLEDLNNIPIINHLPNTPKLKHPAFKTKGENRNTWVLSEY